MGYPMMPLPAPPAITSLFFFVIARPVSAPGMNDDIEARRPSIACPRLDRSFTHDLLTIQGC